MILSRSRDDLNLNQTYVQQQVEEEEDIWYSKEKLFKVSVVPIFFHLFPSQCEHTNNSGAAVHERRESMKNTFITSEREDPLQWRSAFGVVWSTSHLPSSETFRNASLWLFHASVGVYYESLSELLATVNVKMRLVKSLKTLSSEMRWGRDDYIIWW